LRPGNTFISICGSGLCCFCVPECCLPPAFFLDFFLAFILNRSPSVASVPGVLEASFSNTERKKRFLPGLCLPSLFCFFHFFFLNSCFRFFVCPVKRSLGCIQSNLWPLIALGLAGTFFHPKSPPSRIRFSRFYPGPPFINTVGGFDGRRRVLFLGC